MKTFKALTDEDPMPYGKYEGKPMKDLDASYLIWLKRNGKVTAPVMKYILDNDKRLKSELGGLGKR